MRWVRRAFTVLGVLALAAVLVYGVMTEVRLHQRVAQLERKVRIVCEQLGASEPSSSSNAYSDLFEGLGPTVC